jgi:hypothetical protein
MAMELVRTNPSFSGALTTCAWTVLPATARSAAPATKQHRTNTCDILATLIETPDPRKIGKPVACRRAESLVSLAESTKFRWISSNSCRFLHSPQAQFRLSAQGFIDEMQQAFWETSGKIRLFHSLSDTHPHKVVTSRSDLRVLQSAQD